MASFKEDKTCCSSSFPWEYEWLDLNKKNLKRKGVIMYCNSNLADTFRRKINYANVAGAGGNCGCNFVSPSSGRKCNNVAPDFGRNCNFVYSCLLDLLEDTFKEDNN